MAISVLLVGALLRTNLSSVAADRSRVELPASWTLAIAVVAISSAAILIREAAAAAVAIAFWRTAGGAALLVPAAISGHRTRRQLSSRDAAWIAASGLLLGAHFALWLGSLELTTVASSVTLVTMSPLFVAVLATVVLHERTPKAAWVGIGVTVAGAVVIGIGDGGDPGMSSNAVLGDVMALGGAAAMAGYILIGRQLRKASVPNALFAAPTYAVAAVSLVAVAISRGDSLAGYSTKTWLLLVALVVGPQLLGHAMLTSVLDRVSATTVSVTTLFEPVGATILAWLILNEAPASLFWIGAPVVLAGLVFTLLAGDEVGSADGVSRA
jgi:drug/metabolite transporter (DMT)-like permease